MKKFLLLILALGLSASFAVAETYHLNNVPIQIGSSDAQNVNFLDLQNQSAKYGVPNYNPSKSPFGKLLFADFYDNQFVAFSTRIHPYPENQDEIDSARIIYDRNNPSDQNSYFYVGDMRMPIGVTDANGNIAYRLNGYFQAIPALNYYYPQLFNGTFTIDSVSCLFYSYPSSPIKNGFMFSVLNINHLNLQNFGSDTFDPNTFEFEYWKNIYEKLQAAYILDANYINSRVTPQGSGYIINPVSIPFDNQDLQAVRTYDESDKMMLLISKDDLNDLSDTVSMVGAWEWTIPIQHAFAGTIRHHGLGKDSVSLLSATIAPMKPGTTSPYYNEWLQKYPYYMQEKNHKKNYRFFVYGRYTGEYNPNAVKEIENQSDNFELFKNSPNPVNSSTKIKFNLNNSGFVSLKVYNHLGEEVANLVNEFMNPGQFEVNFETNSLPTGSYFYSLSAGNNSKTLSMIIIK